MVMRELVGGLPLEMKLLERHEFSSQTFVPLDVGRWLVVVCPHAPLGGPDVAHSRALIAGPDQGITYRMNNLPHEHLASRVHRARLAGTLCHVHMARRQQRRRGVRPSHPLSPSA